jgi:hypothetical protein
MNNGFKHKPAHTAEEAKEFKELKCILNCRGFLIGEETKRWTYLFDKLAARIIPALGELGELGDLDYKDLFRRN